MTKICIFDEFQQIVAQVFHFPHLLDVSGDFSPRTLPTHKFQTVREQVDYWAVTGALSCQRVMNCTVFDLWNASRFAYNVALRVGNQLFSLSS